MDALGHKYECYIADTSPILSQQFTKTGYDADLPVWVNVPRIARSEPYTALQIPLDYSYNTLGIKISSEDDIQMKAKVPYRLAKGTGTNPSMATFTFNNLSEDTRAQIEVGHSLSLSAGYDSIPNMSTIFIGTIQKMETVGNVTAISATEAGDVMKNVHINRTYPPDTTTLEIFRSFANEFKKTGVPLGSIEQTKRANYAIGHQFSFNTKLSDAMTDFCRMMAYRYFVSKNRLYFVAANSTTYNDAIAIYEENIIGNIKFTDDKTATSDADIKKRGRGIRFTTFLNGEIGLETPLKIMSGKHAGLYKPTEVNFNMDYEKGPWSVTIAATEAGGGAEE